MSVAPGWNLSLLSLPSPTLLFVLCVRTLAVKHQMCTQQKDDSAGWILSTVSFLWPRVLVQTVVVVRHALLPYTDVVLSPAHSTQAPGLPLSEQACEKAASYMREKETLDNVWNWFPKHHPEFISHSSWGFSEEKTRWHKNKGHVKVRRLWRLEPWVRMFVLTVKLMQFDSLKFTPKVSSDRKVVWCEKQKTGRWDMEKWKWKEEVMRNVWGNLEDLTLATFVKQIKRCWGSSRARAHTQTARVTHIWLIRSK